MADKPRIPPFGLRMPNDLKGWVKETAQKEGRSQNNLVVSLLESARAAAGDAGVQSNVPAAE